MESRSTSNARARARRLASVMFRQRAGSRSYSLILPAPMPVMRDRLASVSPRMERMAATPCSPCRRNGRRSESSHMRIESRYAMTGDAIRPVSDSAVVVAMRVRSDAISLPSRAMMSVRRRPRPADGLATIRPACADSTASPRCAIALAAMASMVSASGIFRFPFGLFPLLQT